MQNEGNLVTLIKLWSFKTRFEFKTLSFVMISLTTRIVFDSQGRISLLLSY